MKTIIAFIIFCLVLFIYLHIQFHLKKCDDLEMYEIDYPSKDKLEEVCDLRQPVLFDFDSKKLMQTTALSSLAANYPSFEVKLKSKTQITEKVLPLANAIKEKNNFSENNMDFLQETTTNKVIQSNDGFLRPFMMSNYKYDILFGDEGTSTPFRYELNYRNYFLVTQGSIQIKLAPPKNSKYLHTINDYENFEFRSPVDPWSPQAQYANDFDKIKCLEFTLNAGKTLYVPAYWFYSIQFKKNSSVTSFKYKTYINNLAIVPQLALYGLQMHNIKRNIVKTNSLSELKTETADLKIDTSEVKNEEV